MAVNATCRMAALGATMFQCLTVGCDGNGLHIGWDS